MTQDELCYLTADDAIAAFTARTLSPVELMEAVIARCEAVQPALRPFTYSFYDEAMQEAGAAEARYAAGAPIGSLDGLPVGIKDEAWIKGRPVSNGSLILKDFVADATSTGNARILAEGAIAHVSTATPEFSAAVVTWSELWGVTRNPWNPQMTPGGSSGGSAAALAAGCAPLCTGSDIGGSIRVPSSTCGLVGFKPPYGRNPEAVPFNLDFYCHTGPMARSVRDVIRLQNVMAGPSPTDIASLKPKLVLPTDYAPIKGWKIAYSPDLGLFQVDPEVRRNTEAALDVFRDLGATVEEVDLGWPPDALQAGSAYLNHLFGGHIAQLFAEHGAKMTSYVRKICEASQASTAQDFVGSLDVAGAMYATLGPLLERYDLLVCPTTALPAVPADFDPASDSVSVNGVEVDPMLGWVMTTPFNMLSRCPVLSVPSGHASNGVPTGIQLVGRTYCDGDVMQAGLAYETALGGWFATPDARPALPA
ncbi:amidase [Marinibacterium profundimaris]|uniref:Amidase n=1 Tax=Marinibacterium profundimaris TaxID=1679460 RepID=A0A225NTE3_9RHOB|nr:amidase family protein [Marinibacterium profundimaris]OWU76068.1 amidase [Marinibacterium profundimaris]